LSKGFLFTHVGSVGDSIGSLAVKSDAAHHRSDAITSAFAFVGISIALLGGAGWEAADDWAALCAGVVILYNALRQLRPAVFELADIAPDPGIYSKDQGDRRPLAGRTGTRQMLREENGFQFLR
jgi:divalent metal cation (Fe/Co/Zn/Cd) transporter